MTPAPITARLLIDRDYARRLYLTSQLNWDTLVQGSTIWVRSSACVSRSSVRATSAAARAAGHEVTLAATHQQHAAKVAEQVGGRAAADPAEAAQGADVVVLAVPATAAAEVVSQLGDTGAVVV